MGAISFHGLVRRNGSARRLILWGKCSTWLRSRFSLRPAAPASVFTTFSVVFISLPLCLVTEDQLLHFCVHWAVIGARTFHSVDGPCVENETVPTDSLYQTPQQQQ